MVKKREGTSFVVILIVLAFFDEVLTLKLGDVFITPFKLFSVFAVCKYLVRFEKIHRSRKPFGLNGFKYLYIYVIFSILIMFAVSPSISLVERMFHFASSLIIITLIFDLLLRNQIDINIVTKTLIYLFYLELGVSLMEVILQQPLINAGILELSPLTIRGFHGDRIFLVEYLFIGLLLLFSKSANWIMFATFSVLAIIVIVSSGSNTGLLLIAIGGLYTIYRIRRVWLKVLLTACCLLIVTSIGIIRQSTLSEYDLSEIERRQEMYYEDDGGTSNWRKFSMFTLWSDFTTNPSLFGHGYESSQDFLKKKSGNTVNLKAHNISSITYDYGVVGFLTISLLVIGLIRSSWVLFLSKTRNLYTDFGFIFSVLALSRFFLYYQTTIVWVYLICIPFTSYAVYLVKRRQLNLFKG